MDEQEQKLILTSVFGDSSQETEAENICNSISFGITKPFGDLADSVEYDEAKTSANLSINDESVGLEESGDIGLNSKREDLFGSVVAPPPEERRH
ncbi:hypothetical protein MRB53_019580 [Persea americana]|uniref:Uncharacterized protein n=1 Tax=Persea americana TaxID=3435 RepID=A0ACC2KZ51_PERAE|nr:hypothetical protein MRB53_019580 [Persea americana]